LCHLSADPLVYESVLENAREIFKEHEPCDLDKDIMFIKLPKHTDLSFVDPNIDEAKEGIYKQADNVEIKNNTKLELAETTDVNSFDALNIINKYTLSFRTIYILGQILRNFSTDLTKETYKKVLEKCNTVAVKLIDVSLKLDHFKNIPKNEIKDVNKIVEKNPLSSTLLKILVIQNALKWHWMYPARQSMYSLLKLKPEDPKLLLSAPGKPEKIN